MIGAFTYSRQRESIHVSNNIGQHQVYIMLSMQFYHGTYMYVD